ncbi:hypothetical protein CPB85DRAFT_1437553 [Mucidula mucida]|nr:hypothetical protein CPB85DRAFT_1437553 [Mucidula mucida]
MPSSHYLAPSQLLHPLPPGIRPPLRWLKNSPEHLAAVEKEKHAKKYTDYRFMPQTKEVKEDTTRTIETTVDSQQAWTYGHYHSALHETTPLPQPGPSAQQMDAGHVTPYFPETYWPSSSPPAQYIHQPLQVPQTSDKTFKDFDYVQFFGILLPPIQPFEC